jgi:glycopeptide antibiotics resistance protein
MILKLFSNKWLLTIYLLVILLLVTLPLNTANELNDITILQLRGDYFFHILLFLPWFFFSGIYNIKKIYWVLIGLLFAAGSEGLQYLLPWRAYNVNDLLANMLGVCFSFPLTLLFNHSGKL